MSQILHFETQIALRFVPVASAAVHVSRRRAHRMSGKQFVYADHVIFLTSKYAKTRRLSNINMRKMMLND